MPAMVDAGKATARWVRIVCAVALLCVGFAHAPPGAGAQPSSPRLPARYAFPDGTLPVLCLSGQNDDDNARHHAAGSDCEACRLAAAVVAPLPADVASRLLPRRAGAMPPARVGASARHLFPPGSAPRAPPPAALA